MSRLFLWFSLVAMALAASTDWPADNAFPGQGPLVEDEWFRTHFHGRRALFARQREQDRGAVVFLGDSITEGWHSLPQAFPDLKVANRGISGDTTRGVWYRLQDDVVALHPRAVVLLIGTNDIGRGATPDQVVSNVRGILADLRKADIPVVLCEVLPSTPKLDRGPEKICQVNTGYRSLGVTCCPTWAPLAGPGNNARPEEFPDLLHPNEAGYAMLAATLRPYLGRAEGRQDRGGLLQDQRDRKDDR